MNYREKLKQSQEGGGSNFPKITVDMHIEVKANGDEVAFAVWDSGEEKTMYTSKPIIGILIGKCIVASVFDDKLGSKGGTYKSSYYLNNNNDIALFGNGTMVAKGKVADIDVFANGCTGNLSKKQVLLVLTESGLLAISTNLSLAIGQFTDLGDDILLDKKIVLNPVLYDPDDATISAKTKKYLGKFAATNKPKYASISTDGEIEGTEKGLDDAIQMFCEWKDHMAKGGGEVDASEKNEHEDYPNRQAPEHKVDEIPPEVEDDRPPWERE